MIMRLIDILIDKGVVVTHSEAKRLVRGGVVTVDGFVATYIYDEVSCNSNIKVDKRTL